MSYAAREGIWLRRLLADLGFEQTSPTRLRGDNQSAITLAKHPAFHARTKHIGIHFHFIRDHIAEGTIEMVWVPTGTMAADVLTIGLGTQKQYQFVHAMGLIDSSREGASCARLFTEAWRCAPTVVFSPRLDYTLVRYACLASQPLSLKLTDGWITRSSVSYCRQPRQKHIEGKRNDTFLR
ncbi:BZ3500_MvSof-1268-A1-R1_Chr7-3g09658 [Microbotryum saponariae]|uniref:BZ3500_MvSof-1268-A1-R1_Chr7-3g09658 protein n=1 Tax=Microbotryum saponariae TaxID=289078 RepID=A0A2X0LGG5_9BASI|nr:BZ3501_MvSof-1269-A2-R1_Chr7-2g09381 [Microbotryum saponariae]SDA02362.1 BZ3500_MvSof-1268-A1-R1_Chr7-3g09658 [Microbotryum saponariae]